MLKVAGLATPEGRRSVVVGHRHLIDRVAALIVVVAFLANTLGQRPVLDQLIYFGVLVFSALSAVTGAASAPRHERLVPGLIAAGVSLAVLGHVLCRLFDVADGTVRRSVADPVWLSSYAVLCVAMVVVLVRGGRERSGGVRLVLDAVTVTSVSVLVVWTLTINRIVTDVAAPLDVRLVWSAYPLLQSVLLALVLMTMIGTATRRVMDPGFAVGVALWLVTNIAYLHAPSAAGRAVASLSWLAAVVLMARTAWLWGTDRRPAERPVRHAWLAPVVIGVAPLLVPPALEVLSDLLTAEEHPWRLAVGSTVLIVLAFVRTARLMLAEQRVARDLEEARDTALAASRAKSMFVATMSHELRTPLTTMLGCAEMLEEGRLTVHQDGTVDRMRRSGDLLRSLVEDVLDFSRVDSGRVEVAAVPFDLHALVTELSDVHRQRAAAVQVGFACRLAPDVPRSVVGDPSRMMQVLDRLLDNAVKATDEGQVTLDVRRGASATVAPGSDLAVEVVVADTGIGIPPERLQTVFEAFEHLDNADVTRRHEGNGLGLAISRRLVDLMGGTLVLRSEVGRGSEFTVTLPLTLAGAAADGPEIAPPGPRRRADDLVST